MTETVFDPATLETDSVAEEVAGMLEAMVATRTQAGDTLGEVDGVKVKQSKMRSMVHMNGIDLPERTRVYDRRGFPSDVPTAQLAYHLSKKTAGGERAFFSKPPGVAMPTFIEQTCEWCEKRAGKRVKNFYDMDDWEAHCEYLHPREWASKLRKETQASNVSSVEGILKLLSGLTPEQREALVSK